MPEPAPSKPGQQGPDGGDAAGSAGSELAIRIYRPLNACRDIREFGAPTGQSLRGWHIDSLSCVVVGHKGDRLPNPRWAMSTLPRAALALTHRTVGNKSYGSQQRPEPSELHPTFPTSEDVSTSDDHSADALHLEFAIHKRLSETKSIVKGLVFSDYTFAHSEAKAHNDPGTLSTDFIDIYKDNEYYDHDIIRDHQKNNKKILIIIQYSNNTYRSRHFILTSFYGIRACF